MILSNYQSIRQEDHNDLEAYKHTSVLQPRMTIEKLIKVRAIGGTTKKWNKTAKRMYERQYGPNTYRPHDIVPVSAPPSQPPAPTIIINNQLPAADNGPGRAQDQDKQGPASQRPINPDQIPHSPNTQGPVDKSQELQGTSSQGTKRLLPPTNDPDQTQNTVDTFNTQKAKKTYGRSQFNWKIPNQKMSSYFNQLCPIQRY